MKQLKPEQIFTTDTCFRQRVTLLQTQVAGLSDLELTQALGYEVAPFSGVAPQDGSLSWKRLAGDGVISSIGQVVFDVVQIRSALLADLLRQARQQGRRNIKAITATPQENETVTDLPLILLHNNNFKKIPWWVGLYVVSIFVMLGILLDALTLNDNLQTLKRQVAEQLPLQQAKDQLLKQIKNVQQQIADKEKELQDATKAQTQVKKYRSAWADLLTALAVACENDSIITAITPNEPFTATIEGMALSPESASRMLVCLTETMSKNSNVWQVEPSGLDQVVSGGSVVFRCVVRFQVGE